MSKAGLGPTLAKPGRLAGETNQARGRGVGSAGEPLDYR